MFKRKVSVKTICIAAMLTALSVIIAWICKLFLTFLGGSIRITFENLPIIISGISFGPFVGLATGLASDLLNTALSQYGLGGINPIITLGAASIGFVAGLTSSLLRKANKSYIYPSVILSHITGSVIIKTLGLYIYHFYVELPIGDIRINSLLLRLPTYIFISLIECIVIKIIFKNGYISKTLNIDR